LGAVFTTFLSEISLTLFVGIVVRLPPIFEDFKLMSVVVLAAPVLSAFLARLFDAIVVNIESAFVPSATARCTGVHVGFS
jgi:hypothetical protein